MAPSLPGAGEPQRPRAADGTLLLADVYHGLGGAVPRGRVKYLRVVEEMGHRDAAGRRDYQDGITAGSSTAATADFMSLYASPWESGKPAPSLQAKYVYGTVPVEADGSAYFTVPAERPIYFQALDEQLQRDPADAELHSPAAGRTAQLHRLPRTAAHGAAARGRRVCRWQPGASPVRSSRRPSARGRFPTAAGPAGASTGVA